VAIFWLGLILVVLSVLPTLVFAHEVPLTSRRVEQKRVAEGVYNVVASSDDDHEQDQFTDHTSVPDARQGDHDQRRTAGNKDQATDGETFLAARPCAAESECREATEKQPNVFYQIFIVGFARMNRYATPCCVLVCVPMVVVMRVGVQRWSCFSCEHQLYCWCVRYVRGPSGVYTARPLLACTGRAVLIWLWTRSHHHSTVLLILAAAVLSLYSLGCACRTVFRICVLFLFMNLALSPWQVFVGDYFGVNIYHGTPMASDLSGSASETADNERYDKVCEGE
jgi:hypothetical protein